jgi:hypothetical protein
LSLCCGFVVFARQPRRAGCRIREGARWYRARVRRSIALLSFGAVLAACSASGNVDTVATSVPPTTATTSAPRATSTTRPATTTTRPAPTTTTTIKPRPATLADPAGVGRPWSTKVQGLLTFRGNPSRTWHGTGPITRQPYVQWHYPQEAMCGRSREYGETRVWCGTGWVGQPSVF